MGSGSGSGSSSETVVVVFFYCEVVFLLGVKVDTSFTGVRVSRGTTVVSGVSG